MSPTPPNVRRSQQLHLGILQMLAHHRTRYFADPSVDSMYIYLSVEDARILDEESSKSPGGDLAKVSEVQDGSTGTLAGLRFAVDASLDAGTAFIGYRVTVPAPEDLQETN